MNDHLSASSHAIATIRGLTTDERRALIHWTESHEPADDLTARLMHACSLDAAALFPDDGTPVTVPDRAEDTDYTTDPDGRV